MKHASTFTFLFVFSSMLLTAQNPLFLEFGQSREEVMAALEQLDYLEEVVEMPAENLVVVTFENKRFEYAFQADVLYAIKAVNFYERTRNARKAVKGSLEYFELVQGKILQTNLPLQSGAYVSLQDSRVLELGIKEGDDRIEVSLNSISRYFGPRSSTEDYVFSLMAGRN